MRKFFLLAIIVALLVVPVATVYAAPPPGGPPGLERAIEVQEEHNPQLLSIPGVVGTAVGLTADSNAAIKIYTERAGVAGLPDSLDGIPVVVEVTGKLFALGKPPPVARFTSACLDYTLDGIPVEFDASESSGVQLTYDWDFGDGWTGSGITPTHTYSVEGTYEVTLTVTDKFEVSGTLTKPVTVTGTTGNSPPVASFTYSSTELTCDFDASGSYDPDGSITAYAWDFGDESTGSGVTTTHTYSAEGTYEVTLTVTDNEGATSTTSQNVTVGTVTEDLTTTDR